MNHHETLAYLYGLERFGMVFGLQNISRLLQVLEDPHRSLQVIHVGGTNGKGSVSAMMAAVLQEGGYRVGLYTSPHLVSFTERIQINGTEIPWDEVVRLTDLLRSRVEEEGIHQQFTFFDFTTAFGKKRFQFLLLFGGARGHDTEMIAGAPGVIYLHPVISGQVHLGQHADHIAEHGKQDREFKAHDCERNIGQYRFAANNQSPFAGTVDRQQKSCDQPDNAAGQREPAHHALFLF